MATKKPLNGSILTIAGKDIHVTHENVPISDIRLDPNNPRIRLQISHGSKKKPSTHAQLLAIVREQPGYEDLQKQIRKLGGIYDPLIVRANGMVVEGNTRLAAILFLHDTNTNDKRWKTVPITRLPTDVPEKTVELLMANYHIAGKTVWRAAAQADQIYRLIKELGVSPQQVADETRMTTKKVEQYVEAYEYLINEVLPEAVKGGKVDKLEILEKKFSHALEFITGKRLKLIREDRKARKSVAKLIAHDKITGIEVRKLPTLLENKEAAAALLKVGFKPANDILKKADPTTDSKVLRTMKSLTEMLKDMSAADLDLFRKATGARTVLKELASVVEDLVALASPKSVKRHA
jgi:hypothetical protein